MHCGPSQEVWSGAEDLVDPRTEWSVGFIVDKHGRSLQGTGLGSIGLLCFAAKRRLLRQIRGSATSGSLARCVASIAEGLFPAPQEMEHM